MKYFAKKLLGHEIFRSMISWATKLFMKRIKRIRIKKYSSYCHECSSCEFHMNSMKHGRQVMKFQDRELSLGEWF